MIELRGVGHVYSVDSPWAHRALTDIDLDIASAERLLVVGANGSGKSTLAWILAGLTAPTEGRATIDGAPLSGVRGAVSICFQHVRLQLFRPTVAEDVAFGATNPRNVDAALRVVGLEPDAFRKRRIDELSGGEQRRVALAGLLVRRPRLLVLDEPFAGLDRPGRRLLVEVIGGLGEQTGTATVVVSHDVDDASRFADRVLELHDGRLRKETAA
jgi:energy-coupling factor transporter ATP-binding protein EcfA2